MQAGEDNDTLQQLKNDLEQGKANLKQTVQIKEKVIG